jgi:transcriptional regulator with XRE-family HTH domain
MSEAELARRLGKSPQSFNAKMKRESFTIDDLNEIAEAVGVEFKRNFILTNGEEI